MTLPLHTYVAAVEAITHTLLLKKTIAGPVVPRPERGAEHRRVMEQFPNWRGE